MSAPWGMGHQARDVGRGGGRSQCCLCRVSAVGTREQQVPGVGAHCQGRGGGTQQEMLRRQPGRPRRAVDPRADWGCALSQGEQRTGAGPGEAQALSGSRGWHWPGCPRQTRCQSWDASSLPADVPLVVLSVHTPRSWVFVRSYRHSQAVEGPPSRGKGEDYTWSWTCPESRPETISDHNARSPPPCGHWMPTALLISGDFILCVFLTPNEVEHLSRFMDLWCFPLWD